MQTARRVSGGLFDILHLGLYNLAMPTIALEVDEETTTRYVSANQDDRLRLEILLSLHLRELISRPRQSLQEIMDEAGHEADRRGLTDEAMSVEVVEKL